MSEPRLPSEHVATPHAPRGPEFRPGRAAGALTPFASLVLTGSAFGAGGGGGRRGWAVPFRSARWRGWDLAPPTSTAARPRALSTTRFLPGRPLTRGSCRGPLSAPPPCRLGSGICPGPVCLQEPLIQYRNNGERVVRASAARWLFGEKAQRLRAGPVHVLGELTPDERGSPASAGGVVSCAHT